MLDPDEKVRNLSLDVVHLLDDEQAMEIFTLAMLNDLVKTRFSVQMNRTEYVWQKDGGGEQPDVLGVDMVERVRTLPTDQRGIPKGAL